ncbi:zinc metalloprotease [Salinigranum rubrum]|uniref:hypothetical protein n=1 Tax=Salinigranum rubrum TaxID=755307 RepID=UPI0013A5358D|nr:hypothetical protein [Salinigranum rubrum]
MNLDILPIGDVSSNDLDVIASALRDHYRVDVSIHAPYSLADLPEGTYSASRDRYNGNELAALAGANGDGELNLVVTSADLFAAETEHISEKTFVFGCSFLEGNGAVMSTHRLKPQGVRSLLSRGSNELVTNRLRVQAVKHVGHMIGLDGCTDATCVLAQSTDLDALDEREPRFCRSCSRSTTRFDVVR